MARHHVQKLTFAAISVVVIATGCNTAPPIGEALVHATTKFPMAAQACCGQRQGQLTLTMGDEAAQRLLRRPPAHRAWHCETRYRL